MDCPSGAKVGPLGSAGASTSGVFSVVVWTSTVSNVVIRVWDSDASRARPVVVRGHRRSASSLAITTSGDAADLHGCAHARTDRPERMTGDCRYTYCSSAGRAGIPAIE